MNVHMLNYIDSNSMVFVNMFCFCLIALIFISLLMTFFHPFISFFWCIFVLAAENYPIHHHM
jgi:hypothetical protein